MKITLKLDTVETEFVLNVNTNIGWSLMKALRQFTKECDMSSKESYLAWVAQYKRIVAEAERVQRRLKALRKPGTAMYSKEFQISLNPEFTGANPVPAYDRAMMYVSELQSRQAQLSTALTWLYDARTNNKVLSYHAMKNSVAKQAAE